MNNQADIWLARQGKLTFQDARRRGVLRFYLLGFMRLFLAIALLGVGVPAFGFYIFENHPGSMISGFLIIVAVCAIAYGLLHVWRR